MNKITILKILCFTLFILLAWLPLFLAAKPISLAIAKEYKSWYLSLKEILK